MKTHKKFVIILIIIIIIGLIYSIYSFFNSKQNSKKNENTKTLSEIQYLENKFVNMFNSLNNIQYENYKIFSNKINENNVQENESKTDNKDNSEQSEDKSNENTYKYDLKLEGVFNTKNNIDWNNLKNEVELIYTSLPTITLDLYQINLNKNDILAFNKNFDILASEINNENKQNTLNQLSKLYEFLPKFLENTDVDLKYKTILKTKFHIFEAYSLLDSEDWEQIGMKIDDSINTFKELLGTESKNQPKQYSINKCYIMLNELKNVTIEEDYEIFLIKYKNLLEEISNI